jgi:hypothetical protein
MNTPMIRSDIPLAPTGPFVRLPGTPGVIPAMGGEIHVLVRDSDTNGTWALVDCPLPARFPGPLPHWHEKATKALFGLEGETMLEVRVERCACDRARSRWCRRELPTASGTRRTGLRATWFFCCPAVWSAASMSWPR